VPLSPEALRIIRGIGGEEGYVFAWDKGRPWTPGYVTHAFRDAAEQAGVKDLHVHDLRHTFACRRVRAGVDIFTVSKLLRHASVTMSERYSHLNRADLKAAVQKSAASQAASSGETV